MNRAAIEFKRTLINSIRDFFGERGYFEMETPLLVPSPAMEHTLDGFATHYFDAAGHAYPYYLPTSPEFGLKKALDCFERPLFEISRVFRNRGELGPLHHPEFNMLEWYEPGNYDSSMATMRDLLDHLRQLEWNTGTDPGRGEWSASFHESSIPDLYQELLGIDLGKAQEDLEYFRSAAAAVLDAPPPADDGFDDLFFRLWLTRIEPVLGQEAPHFVRDYPRSMAALARLLPADQRYAERWELYIHGLEIANAFGELTDGAELKERWEMSNRERRLVGKKPHPIDPALLEAVDRMPETTGVAVGIERLAMALTGIQDIREFFLLSMQDSC